jgi:thymidylate kinase
VLLTFSGYNASGKTTAIRNIEARLAAEGVPSRVVRFFLLDVSRRWRPRPPSPGQSSATDVPSVRASERQPGSVAKPFRWYHFAKMVAMAAQVVVMRVRWRSEVILCSQYAFDNLVHFRPQGLWYRLAVWLTPRPNAAFLLSVDVSEYERRFLDRLQQRHGVRVERLPEADRADIRHMVARYRDLTRSFPYVRTVNATSPADLEHLWNYVRQLVNPCSDLQPTEHVYGAPKDA